jgi:hypothetical protein
MVQELREEIKEIKENIKTLAKSQESSQLQESG